MLDGKELSRNTRTFIQKMQDRGGRKTEANSIEVTPTKKLPNELSLSSFSFDPNYCSQIQSIAYQSWNSCKSAFNYQWKWLTKQKVLVTFISTTSSKCFSPLA